MLDAQPAEEQPRPGREGLKFRVAAKIFIYGNLALTCHVSTSHVVICDFSGRKARRLDADRECCQE